MSSFDWGGGGGGGSTPDASSTTKGIIQLTGNLGGTSSSPTVTDLTITGETFGSILYNNGTDWVQLSPGTSGQVLSTLGVGFAPSWINVSSTDATSSVKGIIKLAGNLGGTADLPTVTDLTISSQVQGSLLYFNGSNWVQLSPGTSNQILQTNGSGANPSWTTLATSFPPNGSAGGDLSGSYPNPTVAKANGATIPASGSLTTGNVLKVSGANSLTYAAINLAGGSNHVTGTLPNTNLPSATTIATGILQLSGDLSGTATSPTVTDLTISGEVQGSVLYFNGSNWVQLSPGTANQILTTGGAGANPSWTTPATSLPPSGSAGGDLSGSYPNPTVAKANGATVPASGSLTTGNVLKVSGVNSLTYGAVNLAGGSDHVTGILPNANLTDSSTSTKGILQLAGDLSGTATSPTVVDLTITGEAQGDLLYFNGSNWISLPASTSGYLLKTNGAGADPSWQDPAPYTNVNATNLVTGGLRLTGDLSGTATSPTVVDLTISGETQGCLLYFNGLNWVKLDPGSSGQLLQTNGAGANPSWVTSSSTVNAGTAEIDFGSAPGTNISSVNVTGQSGITSSSTINVYLTKTSTTTHNTVEHQMVGLALSLTAGDIVNGVGFSIYGFSSLRLTGTFKINWEWR